MAGENTSEIGFERQIWEAACVLRGNIDASEYKSVILGLIFLKYISDKFENKHRELVAEGGSEKYILGRTYESCLHFSCISLSFCCLLQGQMWVQNVLPKRGADHLKIIL